jgi:ActR/RegA family two-component response regulator
MKKERGKILVIDDDESILILTRYLLNQHYTDVITLNDPGQLNEVLKENHIDVAHLNMNYTTGASNGQEGFDLLRYFTKNAPATRVIMMTAYSDVDIAIKAIKEGADDFIVKPWENTKFLSTISGACHKSPGGKILNSKHLDIPEYKAGIHCGRVITGVVGTYKKEVVYTGDVLNTTSRIEGQCNSYGVNLLISKDLCDLLDEADHLDFNKIGEINLRGKALPVALYTCTRI